MLTLAYTGDFLVALGCFLALAIVWASFCSAWRWVLASAFVWIVTCGLLACAHMLDMRLLLGVFEHGHTGLAWWYKIAALWTYFDGSFLLWTAFIATMCWVRFATSSLLPAREALLWGALLLGHGLIIIISSNPFAIMSELPAEGLGFTPSLHVAHVVFHPPIMYLGMALLALPAITALSQPYSPESATLCQRYGKWAYMILTLGLCLGGLWAYTELGWGGMWFWDPVETMALIPWVAHLMVWHQWPKRKELGWGLAPIPFMLVLFQVWGVRSGWLVSIHSFARDDEKGWLLLIGSLCFAVLAIGHIIRYWSSLCKPHYSRMTLGVFTGMILVLMIGMVWPFLSDGMPDAAWFNGMLMPFVVAGVWMSTRPCDRRYLLGVALVGSIVFALTPSPCWISITAWGAGLWMLCGSWSFVSYQKWGHIAFGLLLMALAWKATWSYELAVSHGQPTHGICLTYQRTEKEVTPVSTKEIDYICINKQETCVITEHYNDGTVMRRMGRVIGWWSHWQVAPVLNPSDVPTYWVGYRHGIHGVWIALFMLVIAFHMPFFRRQHQPSERL